MLRIYRGLGLRRLGIDLHRIPARYYCHYVLLHSISRNVTRHDTNATYLRYAALPHASRARRHNLRATTWRRFSGLSHHVASGFRGYPTRRPAAPVHLQPTPPSSVYVRRAASLSTLPTRPSFGETLPNKAIDFARLGIATTTTSSFNPRNQPPGEPVIVTLATRPFDTGPLLVGGLELQLAGLHCRCLSALG